VLFYSPTCGHCEYVINEVLLPMKEKYGEQLQIMAIDVTQPAGQELFLSALHTFELEHSGVPFLVFDDQYLIGSADIPNQFLGLVETYLAQGGLDWPKIPGLEEAVEAPQNTPPPTPTIVPAKTSALPATRLPETNPRPSTSPSSVETSENLLPYTESSNWLDKFAEDPVGNTLSVIVLIGMLGSIVWAVAVFKSTNNFSLKGIWGRAIPILCLLGFGVASYLAYVETSQVDAVCGPVGDCNTVQQSEYARLFGVLPIGILGVFGYVAIFVAWLVGRYAKHRFAGLAVISLFTMTVLGTLFSIYLTFLEPFVIGATCAWCLTSAILMTALMLLTVRPAKATLSRLAQPRA
jgi:uncharacterized membrane protein